MSESKKFIQISTGMYDNGDKQDFVLYALDKEGQVWYFNQDAAEWKRLSAVREYQR